MQGKIGFRNVQMAIVLANLTFQKITLTCILLNKQFNRVRKQIRKMFKVVKITSKMNGKALTLSEGQFGTKKNSFIFTGYQGSNRQHFQLVPDHDKCTIKCISGGLVMDCKDESSEIYNPVIAWKAHGKSNQRWSIREFEDKGFAIENDKSNLCLELEGGIDADGMNAVQNKFYRNLNQLWKIDEVKISEEIEKVGSEIKPKIAHISLRGKFENWKDKF